MGSPLGGARLKLERGREHVQSLLAEARTFLEGNPYRIEVVERDDQRVFVLRASADPPPRLAVLAGDAAHNLRSALDLAVCELVARNGGSVTEDTAFPIVKERSGLRPGLARLRGAPTSAVDVVRELDPCRDGNPSLWRLHRLDILDKHRLLMVVGMSYRSFTFDPAKRMFKEHPDFFQGEAPPSLPIAIRPADRMFPLKDGDELFAEPAAERTVEPSFNFELSLYAEGVVEDEPVGETCEDLDRTVSSVLDRLEQC
jgi:hypothetical protein